jgi:hypothetical protein
VQLAISRAFSSAVAIWPATAASSAMSSLLSGSPLSFRRGEHGNRPVLRHTGHEVVEAGVAPEFDFFDREAPDRSGIVERDVVPSTSRLPTADRLATPVDAIAESRGPHRSEVRRDFVLEQQRHPIDEQRFHDAGYEPRAKSLQVEVAVEIARESDSARR